MNEIIWFTIGFTVTLAIISFADVMTTKACLVK